MRREAWGRACGFVMIHSELELGVPVWTWHGRPCTVQARGWTLDVGRQTSMTDGG